MANEILAENIAFDENGLYIPQTWLDGVGEENFTPMTADRMNHIEQGIKGLSDAWDSQYQQLASGVYLTKIGDVAYLEFEFFSKTITEWAWTTVLTLPEDIRPTRAVFDSVSGEDIDGHAGVFHDVWIEAQPNGEVMANPGLKDVRALFGKVTIPLT